MKTNKPLEEAIFRAPESTEESRQSQQEELYHLGTMPRQQNDEPSAREDFINEKPRNCIESLQTLRKLEYDVVRIKKGKK